MTRPLIRPVALPLDMDGGLFLCAMPGREAPLTQSFFAMQNAGISQLICLCGPVEVTAKSPDYARALAEGLGQIQVWVCPIADYSVPADSVSFDELVVEASAGLHRGHSILVHCNAGIGRTGLFAICLLVASGLSLEEARRLILAAGSGPETPEQEAFVTKFAAHTA